MSKKKRKTHHVIAKVKPRVVAAIAKVHPDDVIDEPHVIAAVPRSLWDKFQNWLGGSNFE